jgi:hypothetical protein
MPELGSVEDTSRILHSLLFQEKLTIFQNIQHVKMKEIYK